MRRTSGKARIIIATALVCAGCADQPLAPEPDGLRAQFSQQHSAQRNAALATIRQATARYHDLSAAVADGFVFLHGCENRPDEGPVGTVYVHFGRLLDGVIDARTPDALIYEPRANGNPKLVGVEFAVPYPLWSEPTPPMFLGAEFQREDEFGVFGLHVWAWGTNPEGLFAESNPKVSCGEE